MKLFYFIAGLVVLRLLDILTVILTEKVPPDCGGWEFEEQHQYLWN
jgi:hypothetical protein